MCSTSTRRFAAVFWVPGCSEQPGTWSTVRPHQHSTSGPWLLAVARDALYGSLGSSRQVFGLLAVVSSQGHVLRFALSSAIPLVPGCNLQPGTRSTVRSAVRGGFSGPWLQRAARDIAYGSPSPARFFRSLAAVEPQERAGNLYGGSRGVVCVSLHNLSLAP